LLDARAEDGSPGDIAAVVNGYRSVFQRVIAGRGPS
jgi:hypothetical protein